jgi:hypothetical protein
VPATAVATTPVPLPFKSPVRVVDPVPPLETLSAFPSERDVKAALREKRFVEDAVVAKKFVEVAFERVVFPVTPRVPATARLPAESKVDVADPPKYAVLKIEI